VSDGYKIKLETRLRKIGFQEVVEKLVDTIASSGQKDHVVLRWCPFCFGLYFGKKGVDNLARWVDSP
jgi:hypothetical protein